MHSLAECEVLSQPREEIGREVAMERSAKRACEDRETGPYVVRDLSWELARYLDTAGFPASSTAITEHRKGSKR